MTPVEFGCWIFAVLAILGIGYWLIDTGFLEGPIASTLWN